jgi:prevent-host-death family protein
MYVSSTEIQNNFGKYLALAAKEEIIVTRNGTPVAKLSAVAEERWDAPGTVRESAEPYRFEGRKASYEEFLALTRDSEDRYEYIDGEIYLLASPRTAHQYALMNLGARFFNWSQGKPCVPLAAPYDIRLFRSKDEPNVVQPDLMIICDLEEHLSEDDYYTGVPALIVEILSESTKRKDLVKKLDLYLSCGVQEYWIANPFSREIAVYRFEDGGIGRTVTYKQGETASSFLFEGLTAPVDEVFR